MVLHMSVEWSLHSSCSLSLLAAETYTGNIQGRNATHVWKFDMME